MKNYSASELEENVISLLLEKNVIDKEKLEKVKRHSKISTKSIFLTLISLNIISEEDLYENIAQVVKIEFKKIDPLSLDIEIVTNSIPTKFSIHHNIVPLVREKDQLTVAISDVSKISLLEELEHQLQIKIKPVISTPSDIEVINQGFLNLHTSIKAAETMLRAGTFENKNIFNKEFLSKDDSELSPNTRPIVKAVDSIFGYAFEQRASDIHIEPKRNLSLVRMRIDGALHDIHIIPTVVHSAVVSRLKILSGLDIAQKRIPQDGRIKRQYKENELEIRISTIPTVFGEKIVMRIFDPEILLQNINKLGFFKRDMKIVSEFLSHNEGIILITGPTGSGKTTTLYSLLRELAKPDVNLVTIEDPVELVYEDFNQIPIDKKAGIDFSNALRNVLRQDPDIIMVGEIRDKETADYAIQAALTGHLVFSTLHTIDAPSAITRLLNLGVPNYLISATLIGVIAQRLIKLNCKKCITDYQLTDDEISILRLNPEMLKKASIKKGKGCIQCRNTGFLGRSGIFEILRINSKFRQLIISKNSSMSLRKEAKGFGMTSLKEAAVRKMFIGLTSYKEVLRVTGSSQYLIEEF